MAVGRIWEVPSATPPGIHVMALTAMATKKLCYMLSCYQSCWLVCKIPLFYVKGNLMYSVSILVSVEETLKPLVDRLYTYLLEVAEENILLKQLDYLTKCNLDL